MQSKLSVNKGTVSESIQAKFNRPCIISHRLTFLSNYSRLINDLITAAVT